MALNPNDNAVYNKATIDDLINDAVERGDIEALNWLDKESGTTVERKRKGQVIKAKKNISQIRAEYRVKFLDYKPNNKVSVNLARERKAQKEEEARKAQFEQARKLLEANTKKNK